MFQRTKGNNARKSKGIYDDNTSSQRISIQRNYIIKESNRNSLGETYNN